MKKVLIVLVLLSSFAFAGPGATSSDQNLQAEASTGEVVETTTITTTTEGGETAQEEQPQTCMGGGGIMSFLPMIAIIAIFYFLMIRPQQKQAKQMKEMRGALTKDNKVVTGGGIHGVITNLKGDVITVRIADGVKIDVDRNSLQLDSTGEDTSR